MKNTFAKGIHPNGCKELTEHIAISEMAKTKRVYILVEAGKLEPEVFVKVGDEVSVGSLIARGSVNVFASVSGVVVEIVKRYNMLNKRRTHIVIENDGRDSEIVLPILENPTKDQIVERISYAGIVGMGGAGFPTAKKLKIDKKVDVFLINGAECEPYLNCDNRIMIEYTKQLLEGARLLKEAVGATRAVVAVEDNKREAIARLNEAVTDYNDISIVPLATKYPQGDARRLVYAALGIKIPQSKRTTDYGVVVNNVHTAYSVYRAVKEGVTSYSRIMTVSGRGIKRPGNYHVRNGTLFCDIIEFAGGIDGDTVKLISGGPMMGVSLLDSNYSSSNTTSGLLLLTQSETNLIPSSPCINCAKCARVCPVNIMPMYIDLYTRIHDYESAKRYGVEHCIECGCCAFVCPAKRTLVSSMKQAKRYIAAKKKEGEK